MAYFRCSGESGPNVTIDGKSYDDDLNLVSKAVAEPFYSSPYNEGLVVASHMFYFKGKYHGSLYWLNPNTDILYRLYEGGKSQCLDLSTALSGAPASRMMKVAVYNNSAYIMMGGTATSSDEDTGVMIKLSQTSETAHSYSQSTMPFSPYGSCVTVTEDGIHVFGGYYDYWANKKTRHHKYDGSRWTLLETINFGPKSTRSPNGCCYLNGVWYIMFGDTFRSYRNGVLTSLANVPTTYDPTLFVRNGTIYIQRNDDVYKYNISSDSWSRVYDLRDITHISDELYEYGFYVEEDGEEFFYCAYLHRVQDGNNNVGLVFKLRTNVYRK